MTHVKFMTMIIFYYLFIYNIVLILQYCILSSLLSFINYFIYILNMYY